MGYEIEIDFQPSRDHGWKVHTFALKGACLSSYSLRRMQWSDGLDTVLQIHANQNSSQFFE